MSRYFECDKCSKRIENHEQMYQIESFATQGDRSLKDIQLCPNCYRDFQKWFSKKTVTCKHAQVNSDCIWCKYAPEFSPYCIGYDNCPHHEPIGDSDV